MSPGRPITEERSAGPADLDLLSTHDLVERINDEDARVAPAVRAAAPALAAAVDAVAARLESGGRLVYVGAGSSGRLALVDAVECGPTFGLAPGRVSRSPSPTRPRRGDEAAGAAAEAAARLGRRGRRVVALSASGRTPYALAAPRARPRRRRPRRSR